MAIGLEPIGFDKPQRGENVVSGGPIPFKPGTDNREAIAELVQSRFGGLLTNLGYGGHDQPDRAVRNQQAPMRKIEDRWQS